MTDCSSIHGSTSSSSDVTSSRGGVTTPRIRIIRLIRPNSRRISLGSENNSIAFGFAMRGGKEFGTGFFVSRIEKASEADIKGLRVGDQIIRANGYHVEDAVHKELVQFISSQDRITLKVRGVGMLPVKEKTIDPLTWHIVPHRVLSSLTGLDEMMTMKDVRIMLKVAPRTKLGLGICKGPEWKPGIFVQFTKEFSVARDAGLRPGDQILSCNSIDFSDVLFSEAVAVMKSSQTLEMFIRTGAGLDLFPGESSGYNSSASSVTGDQSPCWGDQASKRLSIVREEGSSGCPDKYGMNTKYWMERKNLDNRNDRTQIIDPRRYPRQTDLRKPDNTNDSNKTIIQLSESGTLINNTLVSSTNTSVHVQNGNDNVMIQQNSNTSSSTMNDGNVKLNFTSPDHQHFDNPDGNLNGKIADICFVSRQSETKTVIVEVHRSGAAEEKKMPSSGNQNSVPMPPPPKPPSGHERNPSAASSISSIGSTSLSSAISEELKKRQERRFNHDTNQNENSDLNLRQQPKRMGNPSLGGKDDERHNALMNEFKRAHRKMFRNGFQEDETQERQEELSKATVMRDEVDHAPTNGYNKTENPIPPPPPPQFANKSNHKNIQHQNEFRRKQITENSSIKPPETPTPDYDSTPSHTLPKQHPKILNDIVNYRNGESSTKGTMGRVACSEMAKANGDAAELQSIESFQLQNPSSPIPRPPSLYFAPQNSGPPTMKKTNRPVSVTIGEYGNAQNLRKEPSKFDFISKTNDSNDENVSDMLRSELEKTLSRSNLKKKNEITNNNSNNNNNNNNNINMNNLNLNGGTNGNSPVLNGIAAGKPILQKTQSSNIEKLASILQNKHNFMETNLNNNNNYSGSLKSSNKVTISIPSKNELRKTESNPPTPTNGILKNGFVKTNFGEKNITFGN